VNIWIRTWFKAEGELVCKLTSKRVFAPGAKDAGVLAAFVCRHTTAAVYAFLSVFERVPLIVSELLYTC